MYSNFIKDRIIDILNNTDTDTIITGMALGADTLFALVGLEMPKIQKIIAAIPFEGQETMWPSNSQNRYHWILSQPKVEKVYVSEPGYHPAKMQIRNQWMVDHADRIIAVWDGTAGGTKNCVSYAKRVGIEMIRINPRDIEP